MVANIALKMSTTEQVSVEQNDDASLILCILHSKVFFNFYSKSRLNNALLLKTTISLTAFLSRIYLFMFKNHILITIPFKLKEFNQLVYLPLHH